MAEAELPAMSGDFLTVDERDAMHLTADLANTLGRIVGNDRTRHGDLAELIAHIHAIQHAIMSQVAARVYPGQYRLLGGSGAWEKDATDG